MRVRDFVVTSVVLALTAALPAMAAPVAAPAIDAPAQWAAESADVLPKFCRPRGRLQQLCIPL